MPRDRRRPVLGHRPDRVSPGGYLHPGWGCTRAITRPCTARALCSIGGEACGVTLTVRSRSHYLGLLSHHLHRATIYSGEFRRENLWSDCHVASSRAPWPHCTLLVQVNRSLQLARFPHCNFCTHPPCPCCVGFVLATVVGHPTRVGILTKFYSQPTRS